MALLLSIQVPVLDTASVDSSPPPVKRRYDAAGRRARADEARRRVLDAARRLFLDGGYAATTMGAVAADAGVSVESVYKAFGSKSRLALALFHDAIAGHEPEPAEVRADRLSAGEADPRERLRGFGELVAEVTPRVAPLMLLVRAAAQTDADLRDVWEQMLSERLDRMAGHARALADAGHLRPGVTVEEARDVLWLYNAPEVYELMVLRRQWSPGRFGQWVGEAYVAALLSDPSETAGGVISPVAGPRGDHGA
jgi:AcrR family transcriptional regulator